MSTNKAQANWSSQWTFILAATGSAVGLGNIWKFPYIVGENGGGAFVLLYLLCIAVVGLPVLMAETLLGKNGRSNPVDAMLKASRQSDVSKLWTGIGIMGALAGIMILSFYSVVGSWILNYIMQAAEGSFTAKTSADMVITFGQLRGDQSQQLIWHSIFILIAIGVVAAGIIRGVGAAVSTMMPVLAVLLLVLLGYSYMEGEFSQALRFVFAADFSKLSGTSVMMALGHAMFTLSVGMGAIMAYGAYMPESASITRTSLIIVLLDTLISITAALVIFSLVFANGIEPNQGPGLMFVSLPMAFGQMAGGVFFATLFFILVAIAALSSAISLLEPSVAWLDKNTPVGRVGATFIIGLLAWLGGLACIYIDNIFDYMDFIASNILLPLGALLIAIFVGWKLKRKVAKTQLSDLSYFQFNLWYAVLRVFTPIGILAIFIYGIWDILHCNSGKICDKNVKNNGSETLACACKTLV